LKQKRPELFQLGMNNGRYKQVEDTYAWIFRGYDIDIAAWNGIDPCLLAEKEGDRGVPFWQN
jgi:hypothetical protein